MSIDPETRRKLLLLQKNDENKKCADCNAFNPQWALPKFGIFICLECAGIHRGLGVHISFVRSITMDQFKPEEVLRMEKGGNAKCRLYFEEHGLDTSLPHKAKYDNYIAEDYKEYLSCIVEGREFVPKDHSAKPLPTAQPTSNQSAPITVDKARTEAYFERLRSQNDQRPDNLAPSQGGKYSGFGNTPSGDAGNGGSLSGFNMNNMQQDPLGTLSKGWSLFSSTVAKSVNEVHESVIKPGFSQIQESDLGSETKRAMAQFGQRMQETGKYGQETFSTFTKDVNDKGFNNTVGSFFSNFSGKQNSGNVDRAFGFQKPQENSKMTAMSSDDFRKPKEDDDWGDF